jgi:hypothetical protein
LIETFFAYKPWRIPLKAGLKQAPDPSKNVSEQAKKGFGNSPSRFEGALPEIWDKATRDA